MKYILIYGESPDSEPWGGIFDIEKTNPSPEEVLLIDAVHKAIAAKGTPWAYSEVDCSAVAINTYESFPFTGTIEDVVQIYAVV